MNHHSLIILSYTLSFLLLGTFLGLSINRYYKAKKALKQAQKKHET